jgi:type I restriction enzyme S subunit
VISINRVSIDSLCDKVTTGGTPSRTVNRYWEGGTIPWFKTGELNDWYLDDPLEKITEDGLKNSSAKVFPRNTVLMALYGDGKTITTLGILRKDSTTNQACCAMIVNPKKCHFLYLFYALKYHRREMLQLVVAGAQRNLSNGIVRNFKIIYKPLPVQTRIAEILSAYDVLIENNLRRTELLEASVRYLYDEWFVRLRFPGHEHTKVTEGVPEGWERKSLGDCFVLKRGHDLPEQLRTHGDFPVVSSSGITGFHNQKKADGPGVVTGRYGTLGEVHYVDSDYWPHNTALYVVDFKGNSPRIVCCCLRNELLKVKSQSNNAAVPGVNRNVIHTFKLLWPSSKLLGHFDDLLIPIYQQLRNLRQQNEKLKSARDMLLPRLMSDEVPV